MNETLLEVLSLGPKFCFPSRKTKQLDLEIQFESLFDQLSDLTPSSHSKVEHFKTTLVNSCYQYLNHKLNVSQIITKDHKEALDNLRKNQDILICKPDKGTGIVLLDKDDYVTKMNTILNDETKFRKMPNEKDRTPTIEKSLSKVLSRIKQNGFIDSTTFERVRPTGTSIPRLYGLPKVHKQGVPLRPILDMTNSPYHGLAKWLVALLSPIRREIATHSLKDTFHFVNSISNVGMHNTKMLSLDVSSLFTNVPLDETIEYLCEYIEKNDKQIGLPIPDLKQLLYFCTKNVQFLFNNQIYRQRDGVAMGSPLGPF